MYFNISYLVFHQHIQTEIFSLFCSYCLQAMPVRPPQPLLQTGALFGLLAHFFFFKHLIASQGIAIHFAGPPYAKIIPECSIGLPLAKCIFVRIVRVCQKLRYWRVLEVCLDYFACVCLREISREVPHTVY